MGAFLLSIQACSTSYVVDADFPTPLVEPVPVHVTLEISEDFRNYTFVESNEERRQISVSIGEAQVDLFETIISHLFSGPEGESRGLRIVPDIEDFQYAIPRETRAEIYEVWLKYRLQVSADDGQPLADWLITGYGKTPTAFVRSAQAAMDLATSIALRDIGVQLSIGFARQPGIQAWLNEHAESGISGTD